MSAAPLAKINLSYFDGCRLRSRDRLFEAVDVIAGLDQVRTLGPNQTSQLMTPDSTLDCPNLCHFRSSLLTAALA